MKSNKKGAIFSIILASIFLLMGLALLTVTIMNYTIYFKRKINYVPIDAVVVDFHQTEHEGGGDELSYYMYTPIVEYEVNGVKYRAHSSTYARYPKEELGDIVEIRYNKNNPEDVIFEKDPSLVIGLVGSLAFTIAGGVVLALGIKQYRTYKKQDLQFNQYY